MGVGFGKMSKVEYERILTEIAGTCGKLRETGQNLLRYYFQLGALVDELHKTGVSYRQIVTDLRKHKPEAWIPTHTTFFNAHRFYLMVSNAFKGDIEGFLTENPELTWRRFFHKPLPKPGTKHGKSERRSTVEQEETALTTSNSHSPEPVSSPEDSQAVKFSPEGLKLWLSGPPLHELLSSPEVCKSIPSERELNLFLREYVFPKNKGLGPCLAVTLNPPYDYIKVLRCPNCLKVLRGAAAGAPVACLECGFPNQGWKKVNTLRFRRNGKITHQPAN